MKVAFQKSLYSGAMFLAPVLVTPPFLFFKRGREQITDRYGLWNLKLESSIWLHGASLGEMIGLSNIARELKLANPALPIVASATSPTGLPKAREFAIAAKLLPFDHKLYFEKVVESIAPKAFVFGETEIWPNLLSHLAQQKIPSYLVNGRISDNAFRRYLQYKDLVADSLRNINHIFAATEQARDRFIALGASDQNVTVVPNTKYDSTTVSPLTSQQKEELKRSLFEKQFPIITLSSLRPEEEKILFEAIKSAGINDASFIIAPRHLEKISYFEKKLQDFGFDYDKRSQTKSPTKKSFLLLDTLGELATLLSSSDLVFVGGTFADYGGHNPLEPAARGVAMVSGPFCSGITDEVKILEDRSGIFRAATVEDVKALLVNCSKNNSKLIDAGLRAKKASDAFVGGSKSIVSRILTN